MRNLRKLTAVVIAIALVLTSMTAAFAATEPVNGDKAVVLNQLDLYEGISSTEFDPDLEADLTRAQSVVLLLKMFGLKAEADAMTAADVEAALADFTDAEGLADWAKNSIAYALTNKIMSGNGDGTIAPNVKVLGAQFATMLVKAMGYAVEDWKAAVTQLSEVEGSKVADEYAEENLTRDQAVGYMYGTLTAETKAGTTVIADLVGTDAAKKAIAEKEGLIAAPTALDVEKISATNLRELVVTFNKAPDATQAKKTANYKIGTNNPQSVTLSEDGKTVTLTTSNANKMGNYGTVDVTLVKDLGFAADKVVKGIAIKDVDVPYAKSIKTTGPRNIKVTLSEPVDESVTSANIASSLKIDNGFVAIDNSGVTISGLELSIGTYSDLSVGDHKIEFVTPSKIVDNAGYPLQGATLTFAYVKDESPLTLSVVESNEKTVTVLFNKALKKHTFDTNANVLLTHTYNTTTNQVTGAQVTTTDDQKFVISFVNPFPPAATTVYLKYNSDTVQKIEDNFGNKLAATSFTVTTTPDLTKPTASVEFVDATTVKVTYSENVDEATAETTGNYTLKNGTDTISITKAELKSDDAKIVNLTTSTMNGGTYTLGIKNVKDTSVAANVIDETTITFTGTDKVAPAIESATLASTTKVKVKFSEVMDLASITDKSIYKVTAAALTADDTVEAVDGNKAVIITFKTPIATGFTLNIARVKDLAGNWSVNFNTAIVIPSTVATVGVKEVQVTGKNSIKLVIEDSLKDMQFTDFLYSTTGAVGTYTTSKGISVSIADGKTYITLVTEDIADTTGANVFVKTNPSITVAAKNAFDTLLAISATAGKDYYAPAYTTITSIQTGAGIYGPSTTTTNMAIVIDYSEALYVPSVQDTDYTVAGYTVGSVEVISDKVYIYVNDVDVSKLPVGTEVKIKQVGEIQDNSLAKNVLGAQDEWTGKVQ